MSSAQTLGGAASIWISPAACCWGTIPARCRCPSTASAMISGRHLLTGDEASAELGPVRGWWGGVHLQLEMASESMRLRRPGEVLRHQPGWKARAARGRCVAGVLSLMVSFGLVLVGASSASAAASGSHHEVLSHGCALAGMPVGGPPIACTPYLLGGHLPLGGRWVPFVSRQPAGVLGTSRLPVVGFGNGVHALVRPLPAQQSGALPGYQDNGNQGHEVLLRQGRADPKGFGLLHAEEHNVNEHTIATTIVNNQLGLPDTRPTGGPTRFIYGETYMIGPFALETVEVIEDRATSTASGDTQPQGVVTAYCVGDMPKCPDEVNASVEQSTGG
jgi:hypothetical protein